MVKYSRFLFWAFKGLTLAHPPFSASQGARKMQQGIWAIDIDRPYLVTYNLHNLQVGWLVVFLVLAQAGLNQSEQEENNQSIAPSFINPFKGL